MLIRALTKKETWAIQQKWRRVFAKRLYRMTGRWSRGPADRYTLDQPYVKKLLTGAAAEEEYAKATGKTMYVVDDPANSAEVHDTKPELRLDEMNLGVVIFPEDLAWTLATGPDYWDRACFTYRGWVDDDQDAAL